MQVIETELTPRADVATCSVASLSVAVDFWPQLQISDLPFVVVQIPGPQFPAPTAGELLDPQPSSCPSYLSLVSNKSARTPVGADAACLRL